MKKLMALVFCACAAHCFAKNFGIIISRCVSRTLGKCLSNALANGAVVSFSIRDFSAAAAKPEKAECD